MRNDSAVNLSRDMYKEFAKKYDDMIYEAFGKASMHFCGRADQWVFDMARSENILALNFGHAPNAVFGMEYLDFLKAEMLDKKKPVVSYTVWQSEMDGMDFEKYHTGVSYNLSASDKKEAEELLLRCRRK